MKIRKEIHKLNSTIPATSVNDCKKNVNIFLNLNIITKNTQSSEKELFQHFLHSIRRYINISMKLLEWINKYTDKAHNTLKFTIKSDLYQLPNICTGMIEI